MILTCYTSQRELIKAVKQLYAPRGFMLDPTYGSGGIHAGTEHTGLRSDLIPRRPDVAAWDCRSLPLNDRSITSIIFDPPFLAGACNGGIMHDQYSSFRNVAALYEFYRDALAELYRVTCPNGVLVFKCQDIINGRSQGFSHCEIYTMAIAVGWYAKDLFILRNDNRLKPHNMKEQHHARKSHCYFWVFTRQKRKNYRGLGR